MLKDLLHPKGEKDYKASYHLSPNHEAVFRLFSRHHPDYKHDTRNPGPTYWQHAEEFLDFLDCARETGSSFARRFESHFGSVPANDLHKAACQIVAAECLFTELRPDLKGEAWQPYIRWARWLKPNDAIITFNYDRVLECLSTSEWIKNDAEGGGHNYFLKPESFFIPGVQETGDGLCKVYKLHGSVDWLADGDSKVEVKEPGKIIRSDALPLIATPGPTKDLHSNGALAEIWVRALGAIRDANVIVFMGYRFPPSDSEARRKILTAIDNNQSKHIRIQTVLGPRQHEDDTVRLAALLQAILTARREDYDRIVERSVRGYEPSSPFDDNLRLNYHLGIRPLYVQDYLTVLHNEMLAGPHMLRLIPKASG